MIDNLKNTIHQAINGLFAAAVLDEMAGDGEAYVEKLRTIAQVAEILGVDAEVTAVTINFKE